ncbi:unnamed protein product [Caenorhabditis sp. 36 PRJEB53466]|nr:unnamed protein product [Caenorhabditis sp. 36 PRJEB53466]
MLSRIAAAFLLLAVVAEAKPCFGGRCGGRPPPPCGLPPFLEDLPADAQAKITEIWKDYKEGDKCYEEQGLTREIIDSLPKEARKSIHKRPPLPFLKGLPKETLAKFDAIFKDKSIPFNKKPEKVDALALEVLTGDNLKKFQEFKEKKEKEDQEYKEKEAKLSPAAKEANEKLDALGKQKFEILESLDEDVKDELFDLWKSRPHGPPRHHH